MDYFRHLTLGNARREQEQEVREESPISEIEDLRDEIAIDANIKTVLEAAEEMSLRAWGDEGVVGVQGDVGDGSIGQVCVGGDGAKAQVGVEGMEGERWKVAGDVGEEDREVENVGTANAGRSQGQEKKEWPMNECNDDEDSPLSRRHEREQQPSQEPFSVSTATTTVANNNNIPEAATNSNAITFNQNTEDVEMAEANNAQQSHPYILLPITTSSPPPSTPPLPPHITLSLRDANGYDTCFRCRPTTKLSKIFKAYADRYQASVGNIRFISQHGNLLPEDDSFATVQNMGLEDGDEIE
ncbi:uncharacterized protein UTRI_05759_B [Ustilago trichophora]|uniref:Rad60/SUMO-like domain-containing protein n=1 Tax=Ustilago trichophora TaxID=86804 RepID=A0A5C3ETK4_9BASI|nr:uncharacterized protein UTRI_05759_B [Ustilago trichophora]